jgi:hypothetical protein
MIQLKDTRFPNTSAFLSHAIGIAEYYGFAHLDTLPRTVHPNPARRPLPLAKVESAISFARREERTLLTAARKCVARMPVPKHLRAVIVPSRDGIVVVPPVTDDTLLAWRVVGGAPGIPSVTLELHIVGHASAIAEALLLVVANAIAEEAGVKELTLSINNIGSVDSSNRFVRDVGLYLRKHIESISPTLRPRAASDPLGALVQLIERGHPAAPRAPQAMEYLTEDERRRFWELLEYLEISGLQYELNPHILGSRDCWANSLFELSSTDPESGARVPIAFGGRYDPLASRFAKSPTSATTIAITCELRGKTQTKRSRDIPAEAQPAIYFAHLGLEARRRILSILEMLRHAGIPVHQGLWFDRMGEQMTVARQLGTPYIVIIGHKEAMEGTVLVREVSTNSQDAIPVPELPAYLKRRRIGNWKVEVKA